MSLIGLLAAVYPAARPVRTIRDIFWQFVNKIFRIHRYEPVIPTPDRWQFCSELVANVYQDIGVLPKSFNSKDVLPIDLLGYDVDGIPPLVKSPVFFNDFSIEERESLR